MPAPQPRGLLPEVRYTFTVRDHASAWQVRRVELREALCEPYRLRVELVSDDPELAPDALLSADARLTLARDDAPPRDVLGLVLGVEQLARRGDRRSLRLEVGPALALSAHRVDTRAWQDRHALQIVEDVLQSSLIPLGRRLRHDLDTRTCRPREYCVQHRESDLAFVRRLVHEEGLGFRFEHTGDVETLVFFADNARCPALDAVPFVPRGAAIAAAESIERLARARQLGPTGATRREWLPLDDTSMYADHTALISELRGAHRVHYAHEDRRVDADDRARRVLHDRERQALAQEVFRGAGDVLGFAAGQRFTLAGHPDFDDDYLIVEAEHHGEVADAGEDSAPAYANSFLCAPLRLPYRPHDPQPLRPRVPGPHTAVVVGPAGEDIHTDEHGRIKVQFHWDRAREPDERASCWVRVAQTWAGPGWGGLFIPRVGMEVVVEFLDGDPDRPLVTGCVYNYQNAPPVALPDQKTCSALTSESVPGGGLANQIRLEDARGRESLTLQTRRDLHTAAGHDHTATVTHDQTTKIGQNQTSFIGANQITSVTGHCELLVTDGDHTIRVFQGAQTTDVEGDQSTTVHKGDSTLTVEQGSHTLTAHKEVKVTSETADITLIADRDLYLDGRTGALALFAQEQITILSVANAIRLHGKADVSLSSLHGCVKLRGDTAELHTTKTIDIDGGSKVTMKSKTEAFLDAPKLVLSAEDSIELRVGASSITLKSGSIELSSPQITSTAVGEHTISGALIRIN